MYWALRSLWGLVAVAAATAVGITTRDAGFTVITFIGSLWLPRILGFAPPRRWGAGRGWHGGCHGQMSEPSTMTRA
jgi:hypothetical protein